MQQNLHLIKEDYCKRFIAILEWDKLHDVLTTLKVGGTYPLKCMNEEIKHAMHLLFILSNKNLEFMQEIYSLMLQILVNTWPSG